MPYAINPDSGYLEFRDTAGSIGAITKVDVDTFLAPGTDPVEPDAGTHNITLTGGQISASGVGANVIRSYSGAAHTVEMQIQQAGSAAAQDTALNGVAHFNSTNFSVSNGFVDLNTVPVDNGGTGVNTLTGIAVGNGTAAFVGRTITGTANQITVTNGDGTAGNPTLSLPSTIQVAGISFDSGTNTLSHYVEGTFSPTITNATTPPTITYGVQVGRYTRIGNRALINLHVASATYTAGTGSVRIANLPFTSATVTNGASIGSIYMDQVTFAAVSYYVTAIFSNGTVLGIHGIRSAANNIPLGAAAYNAGNPLITSIAYEI